MNKKYRWRREFQESGKCFWNRSKLPSISSMFYALIFIQNFGAQNHKAVFWVWNFLAPKYRQNKLAWNVDEIDTCSYYRFHQSHPVLWVQMGCWAEAGRPWAGSLSNQFRNTVMSRPRLRRISCFTIRHSKWSGIGLSSVWPSTRLWWFHTIW